jgi:pyruvate dehydrogenase E2 component (dihydrolipoamide acetyltransferase)
MEAPAPLEDRLEALGYARGSYTMRPVERLRAVIARRMTESARDIPHFQLGMDVLLDPLLAARAVLNADGAGEKISINDMVVKAAALALMAVPDANVSYLPDAMLQHAHADIAVAVSVRGGLTTPILRQAESKPLAAIAAEMRDLAARARRFRLQPDEYTGGTFTISNLGMFGITSFSSVLNPPQAAILSVGCARTRPVLSLGELQTQSFMSLTLTCDHRALDGATGARLLAAIRDMIEQPAHLSPEP